MILQPLIAVRPGCLGSFGAAFALASFQAECAGWMRCTGEEGSIDGLHDAAEADGDYGALRPATSHPTPGHQIYPYLLRKVAVTRPNHVWAMDITYTHGAGVCVSGGGRRRSAARCSVAALDDGKRGRAWRR